MIWACCKMHALSPKKKHIGWPQKGWPMCHFAVEGERKNAVYRFIISGSIDLLMQWIGSDYATSEQAESELLYTLCQACIFQAEITA